MKNAENSVFHIDKSNNLRKNMENNTHERTRWKKNPSHISSSQTDTLFGSNSFTEQMRNMNDTNTSKEDDTNYKNIKL